MPIEIKEIIIKAVVENKAESPKKDTGPNLEFSTTELELLIEEMYRKLKQKNER